MKRFRLDLLLAVLFVLVMGFRMLPPTLHEVLGLIMLAGLCVHLAWNVRWFSSLGRGGWRRLRVVQTLLNVLLLASTATALVTGIIISNHVLRPLWIGVPLHSSIFVHQLHVASACVMLACLIGLYAIAFFYLQKWLARKAAAKAAPVKGGAAS